MTLIEWQNFCKRWIDECVEHQRQPFHSEWAERAFLEQLIKRMEHAWIRSIKE
jgi:hypothetical protein